MRRYSTEWDLSKLLQSWLLNTDLWDELVLSTMDNAGKQSKFVVVALNPVLSRQKWGWNFEISKNSIQNIEAAFTIAQSKKIT